VTAIRTPTLWFSQEAGRTPEPWKYFQLDGVLLNAYSILQKPSISNKMKRNGVHDYLNFYGPVMMDSGGFLFMKKTAMRMRAQTISDLYEATKPNFGVVLDHPLTLGLTGREVKGRQLLTLRNTRRMISGKKNSNPELIPVIHGHTIESVRWFIRRLNAIGEFRLYGLGSLVPSVFNARGVGGIHNVIRIVSYVRKALPGKKIHVFGVGSAITMHLMFAAGADSLDSSSWRSKAAYGIIQLPGIGDRYITGRAGKATGKKYLNLSRIEKKLLEVCKCPVCRREGLTGLRHSFKMRALHNAWVLQKEVERARKLLATDEYEDYADEVVGKSRFSNALDLAKMLKNELNGNCFPM
jgi:7-cyano-7-deazaguanine tRNA-ribosyltransferase